MFSALKKTIEENKINLNFHKFDFTFQNNENNNEKMLFTYLNNRELDLEKSRIKDLYSLLRTTYDNVGHSVSTNLKHKIVFDTIEKMSNRKVLIASKNERAQENKKAFSFKEFFSSLAPKYSPMEETISTKKKKKIINIEKEEEEPFIEVTDLLKKINEKNDLKEVFEREEIENILEDLQKLGMIVYFKKKSLSETIISNPQWFNEVFISILDYGRKSIEIILECIHNKLKQTNNSKMKEEFLKLMTWLKGNSKKESVQAIWEDKDELKLSNLDKISFENLLIKLEDLIEKLVEMKENSVFEIEQIKEVLSYSYISQKFILIDENTLITEVIDKVLDDYRNKGDKVFKEKKEFLLNILTQFDFVIPTKRLKYRMDDFKVIRKERTYVVPLLFPSYNPAQKSYKIVFKNKDYDKKMKEKEEWNSNSFENEWIVDYFLPFKPSAVWKLLFMRIRGCCVGANESEREMQEEVYWLNGFSFRLIENDPTKAKSIVELEFIEDKYKFGQVVMKISIKSNLFDMNLFYSSLHQTVQSFVKEWIVFELYKKINIKITKKIENQEFFSIQSYFIISETLELNDIIEQYLLKKEKTKENNNTIDKFKCFNCGFLISLLDLKNNTCDKCNYFYLFL